MTGPGREGGPPTTDPAATRQSRDDTGRPGRLRGGPDHDGQPGGRAAALAARQAALVGALTSGSPVPDGFDPVLIEAARVALLRKRAGEVARQWPLLAAGFGHDWTATFARWAAARPTRGALRDGWDLARELASRRELARLAEVELAGREVALRYDGKTTPRPRRAPAMRRANGTFVVQLFGKVRALNGS